MTEAAVTLGQAYSQLRLRLRAAGIATADLDARLLVMAAANVVAADILARPEQPISPDAMAQLSEMQTRRLRFEPVSRILGEREFFGRPFFVTPDTLDPRPDTELLVETVLNYIKKKSLGSTPLRILDIGTGTGCILLTLLAELEGATGVGLDISADALANAHRNAERHSLADRVMFELRDACAGFDDNFAGLFDIVVSNPPYIPSEDIPSLEPDVRLYDPVLALDGGGDGLRFYRLIANGLTSLTRKGFVALEIGVGQSAAVQNIFQSALPLDAGADIQVRYDLSGHPRCVAIALQGS